VPCACWAMQKDCGTTATATASSNARISERIFLP
jgi:hypothetical protein